MKKLLLSLIATCFLAFPALAQQDTVVEEIVARVNNSIITRHDLSRNKEQSPQEQANSLRDLIDQQLLVQKAADLGISAEADLVKRLDEIRKDAKANSMEELQKMAEAQGVKWEEFKQNTKNSILTQKVISSEVGSRIQFTREEIQKYYDEHRGEISQPERVRLGEILIPITPAGSKAGSTPESTEEQVSAAEAKANDVYQQLKAGAKFDEMASKVSSGSTADQGGDLGYFKRKDLAKELEDKAFALKSGDFTQPIRTRQGFIILRVTDHIEAGTPPLERVREQIQEQLYGQKVQPALRDSLTRLREEAYIDIKPGYIDTGASPNQTKLIYTEDTGPKTKQIRGKFGMGKKRTVVAVGRSESDKPVGSTSGIGLAKAEVNAKQKAETERKAAAQAEAARAAAEAAENEKLSHMSPSEKKKYLAQKKKAAKQEAKLESKEIREQKKAAEAKRKAEEAKAAKNGKKPGPASSTAENGQTADGQSGPPKKKKTSWF